MAVPGQDYYRDVIERLTAIERGLAVREADHLRKVGRVARLAFLVLLASERVTGSGICTVALRFFRPDAAIARCTCHRSC